MKVKNLYVHLISLFLLISSMNGITASEPEFLINTFGSIGSGNGEFSNPYQVIFADGEYFVMDTINDRIQTFDTDLNYLNQFGGTGAGLGQLDGALALTYNGTYIFVAEYTNDRISIFNTDGGFIDTFGTFGTLDGELDGPSDIFFHDGIIWITELDNGRISAFNESNFDFINTYDSALINQPYGLTIKDGSVFVIDNAEDNVLVYDIDNFSFRYSFHDSGDEFGKLTTPIEIQLVNDYFIVSDLALDKIMIYDQSGYVLEEIYGNLEGPTRFAINNNEILVPEINFDQISIFRGVAEPYNVVALSGDNGVSLTWEINNNEGALKVMSYNIYRDEGSGIQYMGEVTNRHFYDPTTTANGNYTYFVQSISRITESSLIPSNGINVEAEEPITVIETITEEGEGSFDNLPINVLPFIFTLMLIPLIKKKKLSNFN